ncbi:MAG: ribosome small subunit-dependent GTPase A [Proteobacteria bacterium]|nr:MAG: ribosome small subunit-dependent GTPase A [Pseudomonadota bacterium]
MVHQYRISATQKNTAAVIDLMDFQVQQVFFSRHLKPICGDYVTLSRDQDDYRIAEILPRDNVFSRADSQGRKQHLAANVDQILIIVAVSPEPTRDIINRYLVAAELNHIEPILVFNKIDLKSDFFINSAHSYRQLGYRVYLTSIKEADSIRPLQQELIGKTTLLAGQSGVGKSSLSNQLFPGLDLKTGELAKKTGKGAHTTSVTQLYYDASQNAFLIDSPGVWEYGLWRLSAIEIAAGFREFQNFLGACKFSNCSHSHEPNCAVIQAVADGRISEKRYQSFIRICESMKYWHTTDY